MCNMVILWSYLICFQMRDVKGRFCKDKRKKVFSKKRVQDIIVDHNYPIGQFIDNVDLPKNRFQNEKVPVRPWKATHTNRVRKVTKY